MAKSKWTDVSEKLLLVEAWARDGLIEVQIAKNLGISKATLENYKRDHLDFLNALKRGKEVVDVEVENALLKNALGYTYTEQQAFKCKEVYYDDDGHRCEKEHLETIETERFKPAETVAEIFWLKNRKPKEWRDKQEMDLSIKEMPEIIIKRSE